MSNLLLCLIIALSTNALSQADSGGRAVAEAQRQWIDSYNTRNDRKLAEIEADDFRVVFGDGSVQNKTQQLANIRKAPPAGAESSIAIEVTEFRRYGNAAVLTGIVVEKGKAADSTGVVQSFSQRFRYTDTWILQKGRWRVVSSHLSDIR